MIKRHIILIGIICSTLLLSISAYYYPGGSQKDIHSIGYDWKNNYLCNLFSKRSVNGSVSPSRYWAIAGMFLLCLSLGIFFSRFSKKMRSRGLKNMIAFFGIGSMIFSFFVITPYHDLMTTIASIFALLTLFTTLIALFKSRLHQFKVLGIICLAVLYFNNYIYYTGHLLAILPIMQKISFLLIVVWVMGLEYFTKKEDFNIAAG